MSSRGNPLRVECQLQSSLAARRITDIILPMLRGRGKTRDIKIAIQAVPAPLGAMLVRS
jgi:hypothetical protein